METIRGTITRFRYQHPTSAFKIAEFRPDDKALGELATLKGQIDQSNLDMSVTVDGEWVDDPKYGRQFVLKSCMRNQPTTKKAMVKWLQTLKGIGPKLAENIVDEFDDKLREAIETDWRSLTRVNRVSETVANAIYIAWTENALERNVKLLLDQGEAPSTMRIVRKVIRVFGADAVAKVQDNPYRLTAISGIGFKTADMMARQMGWSTQRPERIEAALSFLLQEAADDGHSFLYRGELIEQVCKLASTEVDGVLELLSSEDANASLDRVIERTDVVQEKVTIGQQENLLCYLPEYFALETRVAKRIADLLALPQIPPNNIGKVLKRVETNLGLELSVEQRDAVIQALTHNFSIITGLPGTGKTSTCRALIQTASALGLKVLVAAPTGRAAKRLQEVTGFEAKTIHRTLEYSPEIDDFMRNEDDPLEADMVLIDETSMVDLKLMVAMLNAVPDTCSVICIGDTNQLPSIGAGMVLRDLINSKRIHTTTLEKIFRQAEGSLIIQNAHRIFRGQMPVFPTQKGAEADSFWIKVPRALSETTGKETDSIPFVKEMLPKIYQRLQERFGFDPIENVQVLTPMRVGPAGHLAFNELIQGIVNPDGERFEINGQVFRVNDRVMQTVNDYDLDVYNGDIGFIRAVDPDDKAIEIEFFDRTIAYPFTNVSNLSLAYASSVHKSQGSEYDATIVILLSHHFVMLDRNIVYTANTRAKKMAVYLASKGALETAVQTQKVLKRNSLLALRLRMLIPKLEEAAVAA